MIYNSPRGGDSVLAILTADIDHDLALTRQARGEGEQLPQDSRALGGVEVEQHLPLPLA